MGVGDLFVDKLNLLLIHLRDLYHLLDLILHANQLVMDVLKLNFSLPFTFKFDVLLLILVRNLQKLVHLLLIDLIVIIELIKLLLV